MRTIKLGEIGNTLNGFAFDSEKFNEKVGFPIIRIRDLKRNATTTFYDGAYDERYVIKDGDLLIGMDGEFNLVEWKSNNALLNQRVCKLNIHDSKIDKLYVKYAVPKKLKEIEDVTPFVTVKHLSNKQILNIEIPFPSFPTQQKIAQILSDADKARQLRRTANALTDQFLQSTFLSMFGDPAINPKGFQKIELKNFYSKKNDGTKCGPFGSALKKEEYTKNGVPVWVMDNISNGRFNDKPLLHITPEKYNQLKSYSVENGDIIISRAGTVGKMCIVESRFPKSIISTNLISLSLDPDMLLPVYFVTLMTYFASRVGKLRKGEDGAFTHMNTGILNNLEIPAPPIRLQQQFADIITETEQLRQRQRAHEQELEQLFKGLLQKYFG